MFKELIKYKVITEIELSREAFGLLKGICKKGSAEYKDTEFETLEDFRNSPLSKTFTHEWFLSRNFGGTYSLANQLRLKRLIEDDGDGWASVIFVPTSLGKNLVKENS